MNKVILSGRLTDKPSYSVTGAGFAIWTLAIEERQKQEETHTDFIRCKCFGKMADFLAKYLNKGEQIIVVGKWHTGNYEKNGKKIYFNECLVDNVELIPAERIRLQDTIKAVEQKSKQETQEPEYYGDMPF